MPHVYGPQSGRCSNLSIRRDKAIERDGVHVTANALLAALQEYAALTGTRIEPDPEPPHFLLHRSARAHDTWSVDCRIRRGSEVICPERLDEPLLESDEIELHGLIC